MNGDRIITSFLNLIVGIIVGGLLVILLVGYGDILNFRIVPEFNEQFNNYYVNVNSVITEAIDKSSNSVVGINTINSNQIIGTGSGVMYRKDGNQVYIVTNYHVIENGDSFEVVLADNNTITRSDIELIGSDQYTDLAVLKAEIDFDVTIAEFSDSDSLKVGEFVVAIGNPLGLDFFGTTTLGIISGSERFISVDLNDDGVDDWVAKVLQHDAAINPGNSGGALINVDGKVIGINSMKISQENVEGLGFAIPSNTIVDILSDIEQYGFVIRPLLGIEPSLGNYNGVYINKVRKNTPASSAGLLSGDIIIQYNGDKIENIVDLRVNLYESKLGDEIELVIIRANKEIIINVILDKRVN